MRTVAFSVPDDKDLTDLLEVIQKFGYKPQIELSVVKEPSARLKKAIKEVENGRPAIIRNTKNAIFYQTGF